MVITSNPATPLDGGSSSRQPDQLPRVLSPDGQTVAPPTVAGRPFRRDRIEEFLTERELFHGYGVPYGEVAP